MEHNPPKHFVAGPFQFHEEIELLVEDVNNLGFGVGRINNWVITVPFVDIGEKVKARIFRNHKNYSEADLVEVLEPSENRIQPKCKLFGQCGGCQYQHLTYQRQLELKKEQVFQIFKRLAKIEATVNNLIHSDVDYGYRTKLTPHFEHPKFSKELRIGFLKNSCKTQIIDIDKCPIASNAINEALPGIRQQIFENIAKYKNGATILLRDTLSGVVTDYKQNVSQKVYDKNFYFRAGNFFQNNNHVLPKMVQHVIEQAKGTKFLVDAYCGVGLFGIIGSEYFEHVTGIELSKDAIDFAKSNATHNNINNIKFINGSAEKIFENISYLSGDTTIVIDPPRAGCGSDFLNQLMEFLPKKIIYVSCAPDTQARDMQTLCNVYNITCMQPIDLFPQTRHIENVVTLEKF